MKTLILSLLVLSTSVSYGHHGPSQGSNANRQQNQRQHQMDTINVSPHSFTVSMGETKSIALNGRYFVQKLLIQAESANRDDAYGQVMVNGDVKGTLYVPGRDPHYVVTVATETSSIEIVSQQNNLRIINVKAVISSVATSQQGPLPYEFRSELANLANQALYVVNELENYTNYRDYGNYLLPIRKMSVQVIAVAASRGDASWYARPKYQALLMSIDAATPYLDDILERDYAVELGVQLMSIREAIKLRLL